MKKIKIETDFDLGRIKERTKITKNFQIRQDLKDELKELEDKYRHHKTAIARPEMFNAKYKYGLNSEYRMMNEAFAKQFISLYEEKRVEIVDKIEELDAELFDITGGRF